MPYLAGLFQAFSKQIKTTIQKAMNESAEILNGRWAMIGIFTALGSYTFTG